MRRIPIAATAVALALAAAACSSASGPAWTYAPPTPAPSAAASASAGASGEPSAPASGEASAPASGGPTAVPGGGGNEEAVVIEALNIAFTTPEVQAPADAPFQINFRNGDAGIPHNVEIKDPSGGPALFNGAVFPGVAEQTYDVPALGAGTYQFVCTVHPNMTGTLKVGG
jgi:plastocyanin